MTEPINELGHARVAPTAWGVAYLRSLTDIPLAREFAQALDRRVQQAGHPSIAKEGSRDKLAPQLEARYKLVDALITKTGYYQVIELASGVATHGINLTRVNPELLYVEMDLPDVTNEKRAILSQLNIELPPNLKIMDGNALSDQDVKRATVNFSKDKHLAVVNEGLMRYLTFKEKTTLARNIAHVLREFGGVWITPDISLRQALSREDEAAIGHTQNLKQTTGIDIHQNVFEDEEHAARFFEDLGFNVERHNFLEVADQLVSPAKLGMSDDEVKQLNEPCVAFVMRLAHHD